MNSLVCPDLLGNNNLPRLMLSNAGKRLHLKFSSSVMADGNSTTLVKTFEYLSDGQQTTADVLIKIKHPTDTDALSEQAKKKKKTQNKL